MVVGLLIIIARALALRRIILALRTVRAIITPVLLVGLPGNVSIMVGIMVGVGIGGTNNHVSINVIVLAIVVIRRVMRCISRRSVHLIVIGNFLSIL